MSRLHGARWSSIAGIQAPGAHDGPVATRDRLRDADMRHDLRHAAATILLLVATIRDTTDDPLTITASDGIAHCAHTIAEMVDAADDDVRTPGAVQLDELARVAATRAALLYSGSIECDATPAAVLATSADISRLLANLLQNSCHAAGERGIVQVRVRERGNSCELQVGDSGAGFDESVGPRGVGLSSVTAIAVRLGGDITFGQSSLGGALVTVRLPRLVCGDT